MLMESGSGPANPHQEALAAEEMGPTSLQGGALGLGIQ